VNLHNIFSWRGRCLDWLWSSIFQNDKIICYLKYLYTIVTMLHCLLFPYFIFFCLKFFLYLKIHIVDRLMHLQWPFACKYKIHQGKCSTNNCWVVNTNNETFKKTEIQWIWFLTIRKNLHLSLLCTSVLVV